MIGRDFSRGGVAVAVAIISMLVADESMAINGDRVCYPLFEKSGAVPGTSSCELNAAVADTGMGSYYCTAGTTYITAYCGDVCYATVVALGKIPQTPGSLTNGFVVNQTCIAKDSCLKKDELQDKQWLDAVVPDFVLPFVESGGRWKQIMRVCGTLSRELPSVVTEKYCEARMAAYHINTDLQHALNKNGCGTISDWNSIGETITHCVSKKNGPVAAWIADKIVQWLCDDVRRQCITYRNKNGLPVESN